MLKMNYSMMVNVKSRVMEITIVNETETGIRIRWVTGKWIWKVIMTETNWYLSSVNMMLMQTMKPIRTETGIPIRTEIAKLIRTETGMEKETETVMRTAKERKITIWKVTG